MQTIAFDRYIEAFGVLEKYSEEYPYMLAHLLDTVNARFRDGFSLLDIGAGTGRFARSLFDNCSVPVASYTAIEPSPDHVAQIRDNFRDQSMKWEVLQDYFNPKTDISGRYDLVLLSHSIYCFLPDPQPYLLHALEFLKKDGVAVIYQGSPANFCYFLNLLYRDRLPRERIFDPTFTSWEVRAILEKNNIGHSVSFLPGFLRAKEIFSPGHPALLRELITFSLEVEARSLDERDLRLCEEILKEIAYPSKDGPLLNLGVDAIIVDSLQR